MKHCKFLCLVLFLGVFIGDIAAQQVLTTPVPSKNLSGWRLSLRGGYDFPNYHNNTPYIDYKGGLELGASVDYYWRWFGLGADFDYLQNRPKNIYPTDSLRYQGAPVNRLQLTEAKITRIFLGIGPDFKWQQDRRFSAELNLRGGVANIKGGTTLLESLAPPLVLNYHAGYDAKYVLTAKGQLRFTYFVNDYIGLQLGGYYMRHFRAPELVSPTLGYSAGYRPFTTVSGDNGVQNIVDPSVFNKRVEPCNCDISSIGVFAGVTFALPVHPKQEKCNVCQHYSLTVTARDKFTKQLLPNTDVAVKNTRGEVVLTGTTNNFGVVVFADVIPDDYAIEGMLYGIKLDGASATKAEFLPNQTLQKEIIYSDNNFILKGTVVVCNSSTPISDVSVILKSTALGEQKNTLTNAKGEFIFNLKQRAGYTIYGKKANYFSQSETVSTRDFDRNTTLFIKLEICMEAADCDKSIALQNIHYDLDKYFIREESKPELNRLVQFMLDNPGVRVEVRSHTDSRGSGTYNATLSQNRANSAVDYVVSQGISRDRLVPKGFGETLLLNECADGVNCSEEKHQLNRRTEVRVICPGRN